MIEAQSVANATREIFESGDDVESTLVGLVLAACELSEDESEVRDLVDDWVDRDHVQLTSASEPLPGEPLTPLGF